jgi:hypothetical protein
VAANEVAELLLNKNVLATDAVEDVKKKVANLLINARTFRKLVTRGE